MGDNQRRIYVEALPPDEDDGPESLEMRLRAASEIILARAADEMGGSPWIVSLSTVIDGGWFHMIALVEATAVGFTPLG